MKKISTVQAFGNEIFKEQKLTIGLDLGDRWSFYCVLDEAGEVILEQKLPTTPEAMRRTFEKLPRRHAFSGAPMTNEPANNDLWNVDNIGIFAYGSLLTDPGAEIGPHVIARIQCESPWPVEYARRSESRRGAPTLVIHPKGSKVNGAILVLDLKRNEEARVCEWLRVREGRTSRENIKSMELNSLKLVLYADLPATIPEEELTPEYLADCALASVPSLLDRNGIAYLTDNLAKGIRTPLTDAYSSAILRKTRSADLREAIKAAAGMSERLRE